MKTKEWTRKHQREAFVRCYELCVRHAMNVHIDEIESHAEISAVVYVLAGGYDNISTELGWRTWLRTACKKMSAERVDSEVRRVRALAEGRLVRETFPAVKVDGICFRRPTREEAKKSADEWNKMNPGAKRPARVARVTRIRRAT